MSITEFSKFFTLKQLGHFLKFVFIYYTDDTMSGVSSRINSPAIVYSTVYSRRRSKKTSKPHDTGLCERDLPVTGEFPAQKASNT